jgi:hypothetical protein
MVRKLPAVTPSIPIDAPLFAMVTQAIRQARGNAATQHDAATCAIAAAHLPNWLALDQHEILDVARRSGRSDNANKNGST